MKPGFALSFRMGELERLTIQASLDIALKTVVDVIRKNKEFDTQAAQDALKRISIEAVMDSAMKYADDFGSLIIAASFILAAESAWEATVDPIAKLASWQEEQ